jgi:hypothetical protein
LQLADKVQPIATHYHWAVRNCEKDPNKLRQKLDNITDHYMNKHEDCDKDARCKTDKPAPGKKGYEPSRIVITDPKAEKQLRTTIHKSVMYKHAQDFCLAKETHYVESFNNVMNIFQDKRISFGDAEYKVRSDLAVLH